jgi:hypothetical protein
VLDGQSWHFKAHGYYHLRTDDTIDGTWFATRGLALPLTGRIDGDAMTIDWGIPDVERGRSTYRLSADALEVVDQAYTKDGALTVFGRTRLEHLK